MKYNCFKTKIKSFVSYSNLLLILLFNSCNKNSQSTTVEVKDPQRHYFPISQGEKLHIIYPIKNTGNALLEIKEIQTSCGCIVVDESSTKDIAPKKTGYLHFEYDTNKNTGYVQHQIYLYGNFMSKNSVTLDFDTHVVPSSTYTKDYEEIYKDILTNDSNSNELSSVFEKQKNYYTGNTPEE